MLGPGYTYILPPNSLICVVTTASPIQTNANTPENTPTFCSLDLVTDNSKLRRRQKISGPLNKGQPVSSLADERTIP